MDKPTISGFWSSQRMREALSSIIIGGRPDRVKHGAYELSLGNEVFITGEHTKRRVPANTQVSIPAGQMALLLTDEFVQIPKDAIALISIKSRYKFQGLVNISGFHIDPGYKGNLVFAVYNAGPNPIPITHGEAAFVMWLASFDREVDDPYDGPHRGQQQISDAMVRGLQGRISSPAALQEQIDRLASDFDTVKWRAGFIGLFLGAAFSGVLVPLVSTAIQWRDTGRIGLSHLGVALLAGFALAWASKTAAAWVIKGGRVRDTP